MSTETLIRIAIIVTVWNVTLLAIAIDLIRRAKAMIAESKANIARAQR